MWGATLGVWTSARSCAVVEQFASAFHVVNTRHLANILTGICTCFLARLQYFSIIIWIVGDQYYSYSVCIAVITWFSIISAAVEAHQNMKRLAEIAHFTRWVRGSAHGTAQRAQPRKLLLHNTQ